MMVIMTNSNSNPSSSTDSKSEAINLDWRTPMNLSFAKHKLFVMSGKGGVGKSTVAANLAYALALKGFKTGILDVDLTGPSIPKILGIESKEPLSDPHSKNLNPIPVHPNLVAMSLHYFVTPEKAVIWRGSVRLKAIQNFLKNVNWGELDFLVLDLPPGTGDEPITVAQQIPDGKAVIVSTPQSVATQDVRKSINFAAQMNIPVLGLIENMSGYHCPHCDHFVPIFGQFGAKELASSMNVPFLGFIPLEHNIALSGDKGVPFVIDPDSNTSKAFFDIVSAILSSL